MKKSTFILLTIFTLFYAASCVKAQSLGAGVSVDNQGNLVINAPLYVIERNGKKSILERAPSSMNFEVPAGISPTNNEGRSSIEITGGIIKGRLSLTIKKQEENFLKGAAIFFNVPPELFTDGANVKIVQLDLGDGVSKNYGSLLLYNNYQIKLETGTEIDSYYIDGDIYIYIYSLGDVNISTKVNKTIQNNWSWARDFDLHLKKGWNVIHWEKYFDDTLKDEVDVFTSSQPSKDAVWVLVK